MENTNPARKYRVTIRVGIVLVFVSIFLVMSLLIMSLVMWRSYDNAVTLTNQVTSAISSSVLRELNSQLNPAMTTSKLSGQLIQSGTLDNDPVERTLHLLTYTQKILNVLDSAQNAYWADEQGDFVIARREENGSISSEVIHRDSTPPTRFRIDRDIHGHFLKQTPIPTMDYDPRIRPWYIAAKQKRESMWSRAYVFYSGKSGTLGITSVTPFYDHKQLKGMFGIDVKLSSIAEFLRKIKISDHGSAFIVNEAGNLIAYSGDFKPLQLVSELNKPELTDAYKTYEQNRSEHFTFSAEGHRYHVNVLPLPGFENYKWRLFILVPDSDIIGPILRANYQTFLACLLLMVIGIGFISLISKGISQPIHDLAEDLERVRLFDIRINKVVDTRVREVFLMSDAISRMKIGLLSFKKYVPRGLVQILIEQGEAAKLGGKEREITLMFTDIENFTTIAEETSADDIMVHLCEYFDLMDEAIEANHGIVDKFIGDAVMAFWGAPEADDNQSFNACNAALQAMAKIEVANSAWHVRGMKELPTRVGLHSGVAIVGNLGSHERLNYTAIGDTVNISSRLEALNKVYSTGIIASHEIYQKCQNEFIFRPLDKIVVKGRNKFNYIYELLAVRSAEEELKYASLLGGFSKGLKAYQDGNFAEAAELFSEVLQSHPGDGPAHVFLGRCQTFINDGVPEKWDGIWIYTQKDTQK